MTAEIIRQFPFDHAGQGETSLLMALCPDGVDLRRFSAKKWYVRSARQSSAKLGQQAVALILEHLRQALGQSCPAPVK